MKNNISVNDNQLDRNIEIFTPLDRAAYFTSGVDMVSDLYLYKQYQKALALIAKLEQAQAAKWTIGTAELDDIESTQDDFLAGARGM